jgi:hypothetical protein
MTSVTYGMRKSLCKVMFDMYQEALAALTYKFIYNDNIILKWILIVAIWRT